MMDLDFTHRENLAKLYKDMLVIDVRDLSLILNMSTVIGLADLAEDEIIPIPLPMKVGLFRILLIMLEVIRVLVHKTVAVGNRPKKKVIITFYYLYGLR